MSKYLGIEIGGTKLQIVSGDGTGSIDQRKIYAVDAAQGADGICRNIETALDHWKGTEFTGIGIGFGGPVDRKEGRVWTSHHISGWQGFPICDWLRGLTGLPVVIDNDANVAALGEALYGSGRDERVVFYVTLGSGVGGGLVIDKKVYHSAVPGETEFGHMRLDKSGRIVEESCSGWSVNRKIRLAADQYPQSLLATLAVKEPDAEAKILLKAIEEGDAEAASIFRETTDDLAFALSHVVQLLHPDVIVLGGGLSFIGEPLVSAVSERLPVYVMGVFQPPPPIRLSALQQDVVPVGSLALAHIALNT
jgi:glucokinase